MEKLDSQDPWSQFHSRTWGDPEGTYARCTPYPRTFEDSIGAAGSEAHPSDTVSELPVIENPGVLLPFLPPELLVRRDYDRIYDFVQDCMRGSSSDTAPEGSGAHTATIVTGQPGIGKSAWLYYALAKRCAAKAPTLVCHLYRRLLFLDDGVYNVPEGNHRIEWEHVHLALVDSDDVTDGVPGALAEWLANLHVVLVAYPERHIWRHLERTHTSVKIIMNPWTQDEIFQWANHMSARCLTLRDVQTIYERWGPTPRIVLNCLGSPNNLRSYEKRLHAILSSLIIESVVEAVASLEALDMPIEAEAYLLIRRKDDDDIRSSPTVSFITPDVRRLAVLFYSRNTPHFHIGW